MITQFCKDFLATRETAEELPMGAFDTFEADGVEKFCFKEMREAYALWQRARANEGEAQ